MRHRTTWAHVLLYVPHGEVLRIAPAGFQANGGDLIRGIHHLAINTGNFARMQKFYIDVLGFDPVSEPYSWKDDALSDQAIGLRGSAARHIWLRAGNCFVELFEYTNPPARNSEALRPCDRGYTHFALDVTDIESEFDRLSAAGMTFAHERPVNFGQIRAVYGKDPDGNVIELQQMDPTNVAAFEILTIQGAPIP